VLRASILPVGYSASAARASIRLLATNGALLHDTRQMHLDLRDLVRRAPFVASSLIDALAAEAE